MKKRMIILFMVLLSLSVTVKAQWAVIDLLKERPLPLKGRGRWF